MRDQFECDVWPDNWAAAQVFEALDTQWRVHAGGAYGLDYGPAFRLLDEMGLKGQDWRDAFAALRVLEAEARKIMRAQKNG